MHSGELRKRATLQTETQTPDGAGGYALAWADVATVWVEIQPLSGSEVLAAGHLEGHVTHKVTLRYISGMTTDMRLLYGGRVFNVRSVMNVDERNRWTELLVEEGAAV
jgi:SPP1 family predicted phage head-tail adaptor